MSTASGQAPVPQEQRKKKERKPAECLAVATAIGTYVSRHADELSFQEGDVVEILGTMDGETGWLQCRLMKEPDAVGAVPSNFLHVDTKEEERG